MPNVPHPAPKPQVTPMHQTASWELVSQTLAPDMDPSGVIVDTWTITFRVPSGTVAYVTIPDSDYNAAHVGAVVADKVAEIESVHALSKTPTP